MREIDDAIEELEIARAKLSSVDSRTIDNIIDDLRDLQKKYEKED